MSLNRAIPYYDQLVLSTCQKIISFKQTIHFTIYYLALHLIDNMVKLTDSNMNGAYIFLFLFQYKFETVDITDEGNEVWWEMYKYDIPVFHFEGKFLMKHRANVKLLDKKLTEFEQKEIDNTNY